jgi:hypothetical protein
MGQAYAQIRPYGFILLIALMYLGVLSFIISPAAQFVFRMLFI